MVEKFNKKQIIDDFKTHENDTGSLEVQVAILTNRIKQLTGHLAQNKKDFSTKRGLLLLVGRRKRYLKFLEQEDYNKYKELISRLGLRK